MRVSVIIPLYNKQTLLRRAIDSVLGQTFGDFELIVIDDGSTDKSLETVRFIRDPRLRVISQTNQGPGAARNRGAAEARGEYLAFLDADDEWMPNFLEKSCSALDQAPDCGFCIAAFYDGPARRNSHTHLESRGYGPGRYTVTPETPSNSFDWLLHAYLPSTTMFRAAAFKDCGGFYEKSRCLFGEDMYLFVAAALRYPFWRLAEPLVWYHSEDSTLAAQKDLFTPLLLDPQPVIDLCPEKNRLVLQGLLADRAVQETLRQAYRGSFNNWKNLFDRFECLRLSGKRASNARSQILALRAIAPFFRDQAPGIVGRVLNRIFPLAIR